MKNAEAIKQLAYERLSEAKILSDHEKYDGAFYLAGYSIELMLKAKVCEHFDIDNLFDETCQIYGIGEVRKALKTHDITVLLIFSGLFNKLENAKSADKVLIQTYNRLFATSGRCLWNEQVRYQTLGSQNAENVQTLIALLQHEKGVLQWIEKN